jgi:hypothetical protein
MKLFYKHDLNFKLFILLIPEIWSNGCALLLNNITRFNQLCISPFPFLHRPVFIVDIHGHINLG